MRPASLLSIIFCAILIAVFGGPAAATEQTITLHLPEATLASALQQSLPIKIDQPAESINGMITVESIRDLQLSNTMVSAVIGLIGSDLNVNTTIAGQSLRLNIGSVAMDFALAASLRYDPVERTLFVIPQVSPIGNSQQSGDVGALLAGLFNGRELPIAIERFQPIITDAGDKTLTVDLHLIDVTVAEKALVLLLQPDITTRMKHR